LAGSAPTKLGYTIEYACLEILQNLLRRNDSAVDLAAADAYAVGVTLFELATGKLPLRVRCERPNSKAAMLSWERRLLERVRAGAQDTDGDESTAIARLYQDRHRFVF